jgi:hypothetical protein
MINLMMFGLSFTAIILAIIVGIQRDNQIKAQRYIQSNLPDGWKIKYASADHWEVETTD